MKRVKAFSLAILLSVVVSLPAMSQEVKRLTLDEVVRLASEQSPNALIANTVFVPVTGSTGPLLLNTVLYCLSQATSGLQYCLQQGMELGGAAVGVCINQTCSDSGNLSLAQNIGLTGGSISLSRILPTRRTTRLTEKVHNFAAERKAHPAALPLQ
jgi:hypothetical protein